MSVLPHPNCSFRATPDRSACSQSSGKTKRSFAQSPPGARVGHCELAVGRLPTWCPGREWSGVRPGHDLGEMVDRPEAEYRELYAALFPCHAGTAQSAATGDRSRAGTRNRGRLPTDCGL